MYANTNRDTNPARMSHAPQPTQIRDFKGIRYEAALHDYDHHFVHPATVLSEVTNRHVVCVVWYGVWLSFSASSDCALDM